MPLKLHPKSMGSSWVRSCGRRSRSPNAAPLLGRAEEAGIDELYLLTTTAENYFPRFGFTPTTRAAVPDVVKASAEFRGACPDTAVVMTRRVGSAARIRA